MASGKKTASLPGATGKKTPTVLKPEGTAAEVSNPLDLWYLCEKVNYALKFPKIRSDGAVLYQRVVTQLIRLDDRNFKYHFPYIGEVGYDMTQSPPKPVMSKKNPAFPSSFPLSKYMAIKKGYQYRLRGLLGSDVTVERTSELMTRNDLENSLTAGMREQPGAAKEVDDIFRKMSQRTGLFRIPDVIRITNPMLSGSLAFSQKNIHTVIEIKFPGDRLSYDQQQAYQRISGNRENFRLLETKVCQIDDKRKREWIRDAKKEPVYLPVGLAGYKPNNPLRPEIEAYPQIEGLIQQEYEEVIRYFNPAIPVNYDMPRFEPMPDPAILVAKEREMDRARGYLGMVLGGPVFAAAAAPVVAEAGAAVSGVKVGSEVLIGKSAEQLVRYIKGLTSGLATGGASGYAFADEQAKPETHSNTNSTRSFLDNPAQVSQDYVYWPD